MRKILRWVIRIVVVVLVFAVAVGLWKRDDITRLLAVNSLFSEEKIVTNFSHMDAMFFNTPLDIPDAPVTALPQNLQDMPDWLTDWIEERSLTGIVILKNGEIAYEDYFKGTRDKDLRISWSMAKSFLSALMGVVVSEGAIASLDDPVTKYVPELKGSAYDGASIRNVLNMASGVTFDEDYFDFNSDINKMGRVLALGGSMDKFAAGLQEQDRDPGVAWQYVSIDTHVIGMVIRGATGRDIPELMVEKILTPLGLEADPYYVTDGNGVAFVLGGLNLRTRDYARFGQMVLQDGFYNGTQIVPRDWLLESTKPSAPTAAGNLQYGYQWWMPSDAEDGEFYAIGVYGQYIYVNKNKGVVIASNAADIWFKEAGVGGGNIEMFRRISEFLD